MKRNIITLIVIAIVVIFIIWFLNNSSKPSGESSLSANVSVPEPTDAQYIYSLLQKMPKNLDDSIFSSPNFQNLKDNTVTLSAQAAGRNNPFAPIGNESRPVTITPLPGI